MTAHVSDFGLAKFLSESTNSFSISASLVAIKGSVGYIAPEYGLGSEISTRGDVYSYGILLLEMFTGKRPTDEIFNESLDLHQFVETAFPTKIMNIIDPQLIRKEEYEIVNDVRQSSKRYKILECLISVISVGLQCSNRSPKERMHTGDIVKKLTAAREIIGRV
uniref:Receptor kinase-like protein Xa21 n=2 Tax=Elaeis guineensis var. tenera TaxID=51953 RepID=A0A6I9QLG6_ELAGV|nr:receptor kinase-like protein Xa21 [Elaeis guineensis]